MLCSVDTEISAHANATFTAPLVDELTNGPHLPDGSHTILDAQFDAKLNRGADAADFSGGITLFDDTIISPFTASLARAPFAYHPEPVSRRPSTCSTSR